MTQPHTCTSPISLRLDASPWQAIPEMARGLAAERAGIEAALLLLEVFHIHGSALLTFRGYNQAAKMRLRAASGVAEKRLSVVRAMQ